VDEEDAEQDEPATVGGDGPPDEAAELRWIRRKVLRLSQSPACCNVPALLHGRATG